MTFPLLLCRARVSAVLDHKRTISGRRNPLDPSQSFTEQVSLGWFIHLDFGPDSGPIAFGVGREPPPVEVGDYIIVSLRKEDRTVVES